MKLWFTSSDKVLVKAEIMRTGSTVLCSLVLKGHQNWVITGANAELPWLTAYEVKFGPNLASVFSIEPASFRL